MNRSTGGRRAVIYLMGILPLLLLACTAAPASEEAAVTARGPSAPPDPRDSALTMTIDGPPTTPPAQVCGNAALLDGPDSPPPDAVTVNVGDDVGDLTTSRPPGTTFWFAPGTHTFTNSVVPKDGNTYIGGPGAILDGAGTVNIAFWEEGFAGGRRVSDVTLSHLTIQNFTSSTQDQGSIYAGVGWRVLNSTLRDHGYVALFAGPGNLVENSCFENNGQLGIGTYRLNGTSSDIIINHNEFVGNNTRGLQDCGCAGGMKWWATSRGQFTNNWVHDNRGTGVWADNNNMEMLFEGNYINDNDAYGIFYEISYNFMIRNNSIVRNALVDGARLDGNFPIGGIYISESGGVDVPGYQYSTSEVHHNYLADNWDGVVLWESGNRFAGTDGAGYAPAFGDPQHWKTQNVLVHDNEFRMDEVAAGCAGSPNCGRNGLFSDWVPVPGPPSSPNARNDQFQVSVTFEQGNRFFDNTYVGTWDFVGYDHQLQYDWTTWRNPEPLPPTSFNYPDPGSAGFAQDSGSSMG